MPSHAAGKIEDYAINASGMLAKKSDLAPRFLVIAMGVELEVLLAEPFLVPGHRRRSLSPARYFEITPRRPPEISAARFVRMRGSTRPPGLARYIGSHCGSNFSLYWRRPWKL